MTDDEQQEAHDWQHLIETAGWKRLLGAIQRTYGATNTLANILQVGTLKDAGSADRWEQTTRLLMAREVAVEIALMPQKRLEKLTKAQDGTAQPAPLVPRRA